MRNLPFFVAFSSVAMLFLSGCGEKLPDGMPRPHPVTIQVVSEGNPVEGAAILFYPEDEASRWGGGGVTDSSGNVSIRTLGQFNGAPAGRYKVIISKIEMSENPRGAAGGNDPFEYFDLIDPKFGDLDNPEIWVEVKPGRNHFVEEVGPAVRIRRQN